MPNGRAKEIALRLVALRYIPKSELKDMLLDDLLREDVATLLQGIGLEMATHPFTAHVTAVVSKEMETAVFQQGASFTASNVGMSKGAIALLAVLWAKLILPKRQLQVERREKIDSNQDDMWAASKPIPIENDMVFVDSVALQADFAEKFGGATKLGTYLRELSRLDFIERRGGKIYEGPLLDTVLDYPYLRDRIINGALADVLKITPEREADKEEAIEEGA